MSFYVGANSFIFSCFVWVQKKKRENAAGHFAFFLLKQVCYTGLKITEGMYSIFSKRRAPKISMFKS